MHSSSDNATFLSSDPAGEQAADPRADVIPMTSSLGRAGVPVVKTSASPAGNRRRVVALPGWALAASALWLSMSATYLLIVGGISPTPGAIGGIVAGVAAPLMVVWLIALLQMRALEVDAITQPVRRQLAALLAPGAAAEARVRRVTQQLAEQADHLRNAANVALEDSSAAMNAITRQSGELRRLSGEAMLDINKVGHTAEQTLVHLREALAQVNLQAGTERERALGLVSDLEKHIRDVLGQVDKLSSSYESKLSRLAETSGRLEERTKVLVSISDGVENKVDRAAVDVLGDLDRLEAAVAELGQRSAAIAHQLARPVESLERAAGHLDSNMRQSGDMLQNATRNLEKIGDNALSRASSLVATLSDRLSSMELVGAKLVSVGAAAQADTGRYVTQIEAAAERIRSQAETGQQHLRQVLREFGDIAEQSLAESSSLVGRLRDGADHLADTVSEGRQRFDTLAEDIEARAGRLRDLGRDAGDRMEDVRLVLDGAQDSFSSQLDRLSQVSERLSSEISRANEGTQRLSAVTASAGEKTDALLRVSDTTTNTLTSIAGVLTEQRESVGALAASLNTQIETLTAALASQRSEIDQAAAAAGHAGEKVRVGLLEQVASIAGATVDVAGRLDALQDRLDGETRALTGMADRLDERLTDLVAKVRSETEGLGEGQAQLDRLTVTAQEKLTTLNSQVQATRAETEGAMEGVAARLAALRAEIGSAERSLQQTGSSVETSQIRLQEQGEALSDTLTTTLQRLETMTGGLESAGAAMAAQGQAAGALMAQAGQQLAAAATQLTSDSQTGEMALAGVGEEISRQQQQLDRLRDQIGQMTDALETTRSRIEAGEQTLAGSGSRARGELEHAAAQLAGSASQMQAQVREGIAALQDAEGSFRSVKTEMVTHTDQVDERIRVLQQDMTALQNILSGLTARSDALAGSLAQQAVQAELASGKLQNASSVADQSTAQLMARMTELGQTAAHQQTELTRMSEAVEAAEGSLRSSSERSQQSLRQTLEQLAAAGTRADDLIGGMIERLRTAGTSVGSEAGSAQTLLAEIAETLRATAGEFTARLDNAEVQMGDALGRLDGFSRQLGSESVVLQDNIHALSMTAETARTELTASQGSIASVGSDVAKALAELVSEIGRLGATGAQNAQQLQALGSSIADSTEVLQQSGAAVGSQQAQFIDQLIRSQQAMREMGSQVEGVRGMVGEMADHAATRLAAVSSLFAGTMSEGRQMLEAQAETVRQRVGSAVEDMTARLADAATAVDARMSQSEQAIAVQAKGVQEMAGDMADRTAARLAEVSAHFAQRVREGEEMVGSATRGLSELEQRLAESNSAIEQRHAGLMSTTETTLRRMAEVEAGFTGALAQSQLSQAQLAAQAAQNERILTGLTQLSEMGTVVMDEQAQRLAMLAQQAASETSRLMDVAGRIEQQQTAMRHAADAAVAVMHSVEAQLKRSSEGSVSLIDAAEAKVGDVLVAMTDRLSSLSQQNDGLMDQLRSTVDRFTQATGLMHESSRMLGSDIGSMAEQLHTRALDLTAAGQQFDRELKVRLDSLGGTQDGLQRYFTGFSQQLAELDTRTTGYLVDLDRRSQESFGRLQTGVDIIAAMPEQLSATEGMLAAQVEAARQEIARLRSDLIEIGREVDEQVQAASGSAGHLIGSLQDAGAHSRMMADQIEQTSTRMGVAAESAWQAIRSAVTDSTTGMTDIVENLADAEGRTMALSQLAQNSVNGLLERVSDMSRLLDASLTRINYNYEQLAKGGFNALSELTRELDASSTRLSESTELARAQLGAASVVVDRHQSVLSDGTHVLATRLDQVRDQLEALRDGFSGLDARLDHVGPVLSAQQGTLDGFLLAVDRTLNQVSSLQGLSRDLAGEHLELAARVQDSEARLMQSAGELEGKLGRLDTALSGAVLARLVQAAEHAQTVEGYLGRLTQQAGRLDGALAQVRTSLEQDVVSLQSAEHGIKQVAENTATRMLEVGSALSATMGQLQRGGQLSHAGLMQTNEETQRLVVRLEQVRALIKNMMGGISSDLNEWQSDMRRRLTGIASELASPAARASIPPLPAPAVPRVRVAATSATSTSTQLTSEALHAVAVDLYRLLQAEVPELKRSLMPPAARRSPMTPDDARTYTQALLEQNAAALNGFVRDLYRQNMEFHQYVDRYLARFEAQYDVLARSPQGPAEAVAYRTTEVGRLYELIAGAIERKSVATREAV